MTNYIEVVTSPRVVELVTPTNIIELQSSGPIVSSATSVAEDATLIYNAEGQLTEFNTETYTKSYTYNEDGTLATMTQGDTVASYTYEDGLLISIDYS